MNLPALFNRDDFMFPMETAFDRFVDDFFSREKVGQFGDIVRSAGGYPKIEASEENGQLVIRAAVPGVKLEDLEVEFNGATNTEPTWNDIERRKIFVNRPTLKISGKAAASYQSPEGSTHHIRELRKSSFSRTVELPPNIGGEPEATLEDGLLTLRWKLPKPPQKPKPKRIEVKTQSQSPMG